MLNDLEFFSDTKKLDYAISDAKEIFGENTPYVIETKMTGKTVVFNDHFISTVREALTSSCMAKMSSDEELLFLEFIAFQNGDSYRDIATDVNDVLIALDTWMVNELNNIDNVIINGCFDTPTHTWE